jgi:muramidase (phage lysozyme)/gas vesicle protein
MMVAPASAVASVTQEDPRQRESRFGRASGRDYAKFLGKNEGVIKQAVNSLKNLLVGTFIAAKSLSKTLKGVIEQVKGMSGGGGGGGFLKTLGMVGLVGAVVAGVAALFAPQIKKAFEFLKGGADGIFQDLKGQLDSLDKKIENFYTNIQTYVNVTIAGMIDKINEVIKSLKPVADKLFHLPTKIGDGWFQLDLSEYAIPLKDLGKAVYALPQLPTPPKLPDYREILGPNGINFLAQYDTVGDFGGAIASTAGGLAMGGIENTTGFIGDIINNILAALGLTGKANTASNFLGMGNLFGESRQLGSGPGIPSLIQQSQSGTSTGVGTPEQQALLDAVSFAEGTSKSYGTIFGGQVVPELERGELTIDEVHAMMMSGQVKGRSAGYASGSAATGRYQFMPDTLRDVQRSMNLPGDTLFTNEMQDKMFLNRVAEFRGVTPELLKKEGLSRNVIDMMAPEIASFPNLYGAGAGGRAPGEGRSYYGGQSVKSTQSIIDAFNKSLQQKVQPAAPVQPAASTQQQSATPKATPVSFINLPGVQGQAKPMVASRPSPQSPRNPGGGGSPSLPNLPAGHPDNMNAFEYGIFT